MTESSQNIKHLYWRAGFGLHAEEWATRKSWTIPQALDQLFEAAANDRMLSTRIEKATVMDEDFRKLSNEKKKALMQQSRKNIRVLRAEWVKRMGDPNRSALLEKMCLFWHGHFACTTKMAQLALRQVQSIRKHALGNFRDFVKAIARDASMIRFLNNQQNRKRKPNENFARELMELFTIGRGHYSEQDIKEAARAFTGWSSNLKGEFVFRSRQHDFGQKTFLGRTGNFDGDDIIDRLLEEKQTARFICQKIYRYFVNDQLNDQHVEDLAHHFYQSDYDIGGLMRYLFLQDWFYDPVNQGCRIKSPAELIAGMIRSLKITIKEEKALVFLQKALGQSLFDPPNVAGWPGGRQWIDNSTLLIRLNLANSLIAGQEFKFRAKDEFEAQQRGRALRKLDASVDMAPIVTQFERENLRQSFQELTDYLIVPQLPLSKDFFDPYTIKTERAAYIKTLCIRLMSLPEYQLC
ncbi:MAG: DUF1800 domain-containing protein [Bacteroidota bacterium]